MAKRDLADPRSKGQRFGPHVKRDPVVFEKNVAYVAAWVEEHQRLPKKHKVDAAELKAANLLGRWQMHTRFGELDSSQLEVLAKIPFMQERIALWARPPLATWCESMKALHSWVTSNGRLPRRSAIAREVKLRALCSPEEIEEQKRADFLQYLQTLYTGKAGKRSMSEEQLEQVKRVPHMGLRIWKWDATKVLRCDDFVVDEYDDKDPHHQMVGDNEFKNGLHHKLRHRRNARQKRVTFCSKSALTQKRKVERKRVVQHEADPVGDAAPAEDANEVAKQLAAIYMSTAEEIGDSVARGRSESPSSSSSSAGASLPRKPTGERLERPVERAAENIAFLVQALCGKCANWEMAEQRLDWLWQSGDWRADVAGRRAVMVSGKAVAAEDLREAERQCRRHFSIAWERVPRLRSPIRRSRKPAKSAELEPLASSATPVDIVARVLILCIDWASAARELAQVWSAGDWLSDGSGLFLGAGRPGLEVPAEVWRTGFEISADDLRDAERLCRQHFDVPAETCPLPAHRRPPVLAMDASPVTPEQEVDEGGPQHRRKSATSLQSAMKKILQPRRSKGAGSCKWVEPVVASVAPIASMKGQDLWNTSAYTVQCDWCHNWAPQKTGQLWTQAVGKAPLWICVRCVQGDQGE